MEKILEKARIILRNLYVALGATAMPFLIHAAYGMRQPDPSSYTVLVQGRVVSEKTGEPVVGLSVRYDDYASVDTDGDGRFFIYVPEGNTYSIRFFDIDGFENGGFFSGKNMLINRNETEDPLKISVYMESQVAVIRGTVLSKGTAEPVSGIKVSVYSVEGNNSESGYTAFSSGFEALSDNNGQFYIQVPERDAYLVHFFDANGLFQWKDMHVTSDEIKDSLKVDLDQKTEEDGK